jgi:hypothetical protein
MNRVATEVAEQIAMLLKHNDLDPRASQQQAEHHARRTAADHTTLCR